ncbi:MAG: class I SAM-dependent methyltransferase, partial [Chloroflexi bacterium]|nr:class I SAM-dependent methyltransferase [Chloroflexota bacterium]
SPIPNPQSPIPNLQSPISNPPPMTILDHFGILAPLYDRIFKPVEQEWLWKLLDLPVSGALLDAGGGTGRISQFMRDKAAPVVVADLSCEMLRQANAKVGLQTTCSHTEKLPFSDATFERVIMVDALHHVCNQAETARELWRILKPGGRLVIEEPDVRTFAVKILAVAEKLALMRSHFLAPPKIAALFPYPNARTSIERDGYISWVVVEKA